MDEYKCIKLIRFCIFINYYKLTPCIENSVNPDQLASSEATWSGSTLFTREACWSGSTLFTRETSWSGSILFARVDIWFYTAFEQINCLSIERYKAKLFIRPSKNFYGQVHCGHLLVIGAGQVEKFTISTPLTLHSNSAATVNVLKLRTLKNNYFFRCS